jgi:hypothetical protein
VAELTPTPQTGDQNGGFVLIALTRDQREDLPGQANAAPAPVVLSLG